MKSAVEPDDVRCDAANHPDQNTAVAPSSLISSADSGVTRRRLPGLWPAFVRVVRRIMRFAGWGCLAASVVLLAATAFLFYFQPDRFAAFTVMPVWVWGGIGIGAAAASGFLLHRRRGWAAAALGWLAVVLVFADEVRVLANLNHAQPRPGPAAPHKGRPVVRVITANLDFFPAPELQEWQADVLLIQDIHPFQTDALARELLGENGDFRHHGTNAILTRWHITGESVDPHLRLHHVTITRPDGVSFDVVNLHLLSAATDLSLWRREVWTGHRVNRAIRHANLDRALLPVEAIGDVPVILGGDFNAPPGDPVDRRLRPRFRDAHAAAGSRWGNTYHRRFPILRIDRIHTTRHFTPVRSTTRVAKLSDHRFVVADFVFEP